MNLFRTQFEQWLDTYDCELAVAFENQSECHNFNQFIEAQYQLMLENERERACEAHEGVLAFNLIK